MSWKFVLTACLIALMGCGSLPKGAGLKRDILNEDKAERVARRNGEDVAFPQFAVEPVTRGKVAVYDTWAPIGESTKRWIGRVDQPNVRIIAPGDAVSVTIWNTEDNGLLTGPGQRFVPLTDLRVSASGRIFLPYVGDVHIAGMSPERARQKIEQEYTMVSPSAQVQLAMTEGRQNAVSLIGGVANPGTYPLPDRDFTVLSLLAEGGGVPSSLKNPQIRLQRGGTTYGTSVSELLENPSLDTTLAGGDKIYVEEDSRYFLSLGAAGNQSVHPFTKSRITALDAMSEIGGVLPGRADASGGILILRRYPSSALRADGTGPTNVRVVFTIDLTTADGLFSAGQFLIRSGDLVYVTESPVTRTQTIFSLIGSSLGLTRQVQTVGN